jgi:hypothetical protein
LNKQHTFQKFYYDYIDNGENLKISVTLLFGHVLIRVGINHNFYTVMNLIEDSNLISIPREKVLQMCQKKQKCPIEVEIENDQEYLHSSSFLITMKSSRDVPITLKQGVVTKRTIISGEEEHFIVDIKPDKSFGAKISVFFMNGEGLVYARRALRSELFNITNFPDKDNYEYMASYKASNKGFYIIDIPYKEISNTNNPCKILLTIKGLFPGYHTAKIEYTISVSNELNELITEKNYRLFIAQGEIAHYHFKVTNNKKRLYISMTNKDKDANMYLNYEKYITTISEYNWKNIGSHNEYLDISSDDPLFVEKQMDFIDGNYYLAIKGLDDCFFNLYISTQDVKIMTIEKGVPTGCTCEKENDICYFRYENINDPSIREVYEQYLVFYTEYTYGSGSFVGQLYPNGNMEEIIKNLPSVSNQDYVLGTNEFSYIYLNQENIKYTFSSVYVLGVQCHEKSLFDITLVSLDKETMTNRNDKDLIYLKINQDNIFYLSSFSRKNNKFIYHILNNKAFNFQIKSFFGKAQVHVYTNNTSINYQFSEGEERTISYNDYHHIADFIIDSTKDESKNYFGYIPQEYGNGNYLFIDVKPFEVCFINININYNENIYYIPINKEIIVNLDKGNYNGYFDILEEAEEIIFTVTSLDRSRTYNTYLKMNLLSKQPNAGNINQTEYSKPSSKNYNIKGTTNSLTSAISLRIKNVPKLIKDISIVRILVNIESDKIISNQKVKIIVTPVINNINRIRPEKGTYYFSGMKKEQKDKNLYMLKNLNSEDDLMIIEISVCKGSFIYALVDSPPKDGETFTSLKERQIPSTKYYSNGKSIIIVRNIEVKEYYLMVYGENSISDYLDIEKKENKSSTEVDILFKYYTTKEKKYQYLFTQDSFTYEIGNDISQAKLKLPELKNRDTFGRENYAEYINYTVIVSDKSSDYNFMESTCYLTKLIQKNENNRFDYLKINYDKKSNSINVNGFLEEKIYYLNILAKNEHTGEVVTYKPILINTKNRFDRTSKFVIVFLIVIFIIIFFCLVDIYRKYRIENSKIKSEIEKKNDSSFLNKIGNLKNVNLDFVKKKI